MKFATVLTAIIVASSTAEAGLLLGKLGGWSGSGSWGGSGSWSGGGGQGGVVQPCDTPTPVPEPCDTPTPACEEADCGSSGGGSYSSGGGLVGGILGKKIQFVKGLLGH